MGDTLDLPHSVTHEVRRKVGQVDRALANVHDVSVWHWGADTPALDVCLGAILVQHTAWTNVEKALGNLSEAGLNSVEEFATTDDTDLAQLVRPAGLPLTKAQRLKAFVHLALESGGLASLLQQPAGELRQLLLSTPGIGPETADVILLYAAGQPVAVHDAYTTRLYGRLGLGPDRQSYRAWRAWLDQAWPAELQFRWRHHAAIVLHCKYTCQTKPRCGQCVLLEICPFGRSVLQATQRSY